MDPNLKITLDDIHGLIFVEKHNDKLSTLILPYPHTHHEDCLSFPEVTLIYLHPDRFHMAALITGKNRGK